MASNERNVIFLRCSQKEYNDLKTSNQINNNVLYYITDGGVIYQGNHIYGTKFIDSEDASWSTVTPNTFRHNKKTGEVLYFKTLSDACNYGFIKTHILACCRGTRKSHKGYYWSSIK